MPSLSLPFRALVCLVALLLASSHVSADHTFVVGPAGGFVGVSPVPGFILATLDDVQSNDFLSVYNALGLRLASTVPTQFPVSYCPFIGVQDGFLATGSPLSVSPTLIAPFTASGSIQDDQALYSPVWLGTADASAFTTNNEYVGPINASFAASLFVLSPSALSQVTLSCNPSNAHLALYRKADFIVAPYGSAFPNPPFAGAMFASVQDVQSEEFLETYNLIGLGTTGASASHVCCALRLQGGYLSLGTSTFAPYNGQHNIQCPDKTLSTPVWFGTANDGGEPNAFIGPLNATVLSGLRVSASQPSFCSSKDANVWAVYKIHTTPAPTPAPSTGDCYNMEIRVSYYLPDGTICLADRWSYYMRLGQVYSSVSMSSLNECGGTVGAVSANGLELQPYNASFLVGRTTGATDCDCTGITNWGFVPLNESGYTEMATICSKTIQEFYFCSVLMELKNGPVQCPPGP